MRRVGRGLAGLWLAVVAGSAEAAALTVRQSGPNGEIAQLEEAREVRVVFAEPMVALGRIPAPVTAPFFAIAPAVAGSFRWSGTDTLIFTPAEPLPYADDASRSPSTPRPLSVAGNTLPEPYTFSFTTPTVQLLRTQLVPQDARDSTRPVVIALRFNQPVAPYEVAKHLEPALRAAPVDADAELSRKTAQARLGSRSIRLGRRLRSQGRAGPAATQSRGSCRT